MKKVSLLICSLMLIFLISFDVKTAPLKITSGQMIFGGSAYGSPDYQTYSRFSMNFRRKNPVRNYQLDAVQAFSVYLNHPIQPNGDFTYNVVMPYGPQSLAVNGVNFYPVFYEDCKWTIKTSAVTPKATPDSPQFVTVNSTFTMSGLSAFAGANSSVFKFTGSGTVNFLFQKTRPEEYHFREANYIFSEDSRSEKDSY